MDQEWPLKNLTAVVPVMASSFAFAYVVGYFYAFDISWFSFFSLSEHLVFALRALPIAIGASVGFLVGLRFSTLETKWTWLVGREHWLFWGWMSALGASALLAFFSNHVGLAASFLLIAVGAYTYDNIPPPRSAFSDVLHWAITLMVLCLMAGFVSGNAWRLHKYFPLSRSTTIDYEEGNGPSKSFTGHVMFSGDVWVLFYDFDLKKVILFQRDKISKISE
jgi:hypothetical protein